MTFKMKGFPMMKGSSPHKSALKSGHWNELSEEEFAKLSDAEKKKAMEHEIKKEEEAHKAYHGDDKDKSEQSIVQDEGNLGKNIEAQLNEAKGPGGTTDLTKVKYEQLVNKLEKIYQQMYPDSDESNVRGTYGPWKPSK